ncbi:MAG: 2-C-methyl-D-erythritol 4-phosphate cytidylyltransferase [Candidatus Hydrogenedentes bacterium]|nr:2-C-methyl-D-erythritol 4-phosphate cytidylyltransferase [Candidatus Hydrogenedentota bacterium]
MKVQVLIPAAGMGRRLGADKPKALVSLAGRPLIQITLDRMGALAGEARAIVVYPEGFKREFMDAILPVQSEVSLVPGGSERQDSVYEGLKALDDDTEIVVIHDAARPFVPLKAVCRAVEETERYGAATLAIPVADTMLLGDEEGFLDSTPDRSRVWACQTPQVFRTEIIRKAYALDGATRKSVTDDATLARLAGFPVKLVMGDAMNLKITTPDDVAYVEYLSRHGML